MILRFHILILITLYALSSSAQDYVYSLKQWEIEDGLQHREINAILEDNQGLIWLGSANGVQRYDGHEFKSWNKNNSSKKMYSITKMGQDDGNWLWLWNKTLNEFIFLNTNSHEILSEEQRFGASMPIRSLKKRGSWIYNEDQLARNREKQLVFVLNEPNKVALFDTDNGFQYQNLPPLNGGSIILKKISSAGDLVIQENLKDGTRFVHVFSKDYSLKSSTELGTYQYGLDVYEHQAELYLSTRTSEAQIVYKLQSDGQCTKLEKLTKPNTNRIFIGSLFWEHSPEGWVVRNREQQVKFKIPYASHEKSLDFTSNGILQDSRGRLWMASAYGLTTLTARPNKFTKLLTKPSLSLENYSTRGILTIQEKVYGTLENFGLFEISAEHKPKQLYKTRNNAASCLHSYSKDTLLLGSSNTIIIYDLKKNKVVDYVSLPKKHFIWSITSTNNGLLVGTNKNIYFVDVKTGFVKPFNTQKPRETYQLLEIGDYYYAATSIGLQVMGKNGIAVQLFNEQQDTTSYLPLNLCYSIHREGNILWLGTDKGLIKWDIITKKHTTIDQEDGLSSNTIYTIESDEQDRLWLGTNYGLCVYSKQDNTIQAYNVNDGTSDSEFNRISSHKSDKGILYFGSMNGITVVDPSKVDNGKRKKSSEVLLISLQLFDSDKSKLINMMPKVAKNGTIEIEPSYKYIQLKCALPDHISDAFTRYEWRISATDSLWQPMVGNSLQLGKIPYGLNTLEIRGKTNGSNWTDKPLILKLRALKPFYLQTWFVLTMLALFLSLGFAYVRYKTIQYKKNEEVLQRKIAEATAIIAKDKAIMEENTIRLTELDQVKTRFFTNVSHELRTPLTLILGPLERMLANDDYTYPERFRSMITLSFNNAKKLKTRVDELLNLSKLDSGKLVLRNQPTNLVEVFKETIKSFEPLADTKDIRLELSIHIPENKFLQIDQNKLVKVVDNLMSNAIKHSPAQSTIQASLNHTTTNYIISVADGGKGISEKEQKNIFDRYYQTADGDAMGGTGIGLSYSKGLAKLMGGDLNLDQSHTNGARFVFSFVAEELHAPEVEQNSQNNITKESPLNKVDKLPYTLLIVEDTDEMRLYIRSIVEPLYTVYEASDGLEALKMLEINKIDIILSDIMMPNLDGIGLISEIKKRETLKNIPFIFLSAKSDKSQVATALELGIDDYITKPFYSRELLARLQNLTQNLTTRLANVTNTEPNELQAKSWINKLKEYVQANVGNTNFGVAEVVGYMATSERTLNRKLNATVGFSCAAFIKEVRLQTAIELLQNDQNTSVKEVAAQVGYKRQDYFAKAFYTRFGKQPSEYF